jgi:ribosome-associated translation inhibitor RaiA
MHQFIGFATALFELLPVLGERAAIVGVPMQTSVEIDFQGMTGNAGLRDAIEKHVADLERHFSRVTACRVVLKAPGGHHRTGGLYEVNVHLALPGGREVNVGHTAQDDERHSDVTFAINDAFKRARRQLQDQARRLEGQVKVHEKPANRNRHAAG